jgi:hypothetical protein
MKKPFLGLLLLAAWLTSFAANATTYTYDVDYSFTTTGGDVTGFITTSCDNCILTASNILSWSFTASDGTSGSSSKPGSGVVTTGIALEATPTGIFTLTDATVGGALRFCSDAANNGADCFPTAGLDVGNNFHGGPQPFPAWHIAWEEISSAEGIFSTDGGAPDNPNGPGFIFPSIEIASLAVPEPPVWALAIIGFAGLGFADLRRRRRPAPPDRLCGSAIVPCPAASPFPCTGSSA